MIKVGGKEVYATSNLKRLHQRSFTTWKNQFFPDRTDTIFLVEDKEGKTYLDAL